MEYDWPPLHPHRPDATKKARRRADTFLMPLIHQAGQRDTCKTTHRPHQCNQRAPPPKPGSRFIIWKSATAPPKNCKSSQSLTIIDDGVQAGVATTATQPEIGRPTHQCAAPPGGPPKPAPPASQHGQLRTAPMRPGPKSPRKCGPAQAGRPPETKRSVYHGAQHPDGLRRILSFQPYDQCTLLEIRIRVERISSIATRRAAQATRPSPLPALRPARMRC